LERRDRVWATPPLPCFYSGTGTVTVPIFTLEMYRSGRKYFSYFYMLARFSVDSSTWTSLASTVYSRHLFSLWSTLLIFAALSKLCSHSCSHVNC
jgi:hypothetical protein